MIADDGARIGVDQFVELMRSALDAEGGRTLFVASADLSHVGPSFGQPQEVNEQRRREVEAHDRAILKEYIGGGDAFIARLRETRNPTGWWSMGCMHAAARLARPSSIELIDYRQNFDEQGKGLISTASLALLG
jgi:AmmeMemoRadiSam system protein B